MTEFHQRRPLFVLLGASAISQAGNSLTALAIPWYVLETTGSAARAGVVAFAGLVPMVLASFFGGAVVDLLGFKRASILSDLASGLTVAAIPLLAVTIGLQFWHLLLLTFLGALLDAPGTTARMSLTPDLARLAAMPLARMNALAQSTSGSVSLLGPILAGVLVVAVGPRDVLWLDAASFAVSAALVAIAVPTAKREIVDGESRSVDLLGGLRYLLADRLVLAIALTATVVNFLAAPLFSVILPVYARLTFGAATDLGLLIGGFGGGTIAGSVLYGAVGPRLPRRDSLIAGFLLLGLPLFLLAIEPPLWVALLALVISGAGCWRDQPARHHRAAGAHPGGNTWPCLWRLYGGGAGRGAARCPPRWLFERDRWRARLPGRHLDRARSGRPLDAGESGPAGARRRAED